MRFVTTDPRTGGLADRVGSTVAYITGGELVTLVKVAATDTAWAEVGAVLLPSPMDAVKCPAVTSDPRSAGRAGTVGDVVLYYTGGVGTYLIKYGTGDTNWVPLPDSSTLGGVTLPIAESDVTNLVTDLAGKVPTSRTLTATAPIRIDGGASANLSADRTLSITTYAGSSAGAVPAGAGSTTKFLREDGSWAEPAGSIQVRHWVFGSGYDGAINFDGTNTYSFASKSGSTYTLLRTIAASSIIVASGVVLKPDGYAIFCTGTLSGSGTIRHNGNDASGSSGGAAVTAHDLPGGGAGTAGTLNTSSAPNDVPTASPSAAWYSSSTAPGVTAGAGTAGSNYCQGGAGGGAAAGTGSSADRGGNGGAFGSFTSGAMFPDHLISGQTANYPPALYAGSTGGGGGARSATNVGATGASGGGGGGGAGWIVIAAYEITFTGTIECKGGAGAAGPSISGAGASAGGGGGGGGGGTVVLVIGTGLFPTTSVAGGAGGAAGVGTSGANQGFAGGNGASGYVHQWSIATAGSGGGGGGSLIDGDYGDITVGAGGTSFTIDSGVVSTTKMGGDVTTAGKALLDDADAAAQRTTLGLAAIASTGSGADLTANSVTLAKLATIATARFLGRTTAGTGDPEALTGTQATALLDTFTSSAKGLVPASGGGTTNYLRADGTWQPASGGGGGTPSFSGVSVYNSGNQSIAHATNTALTWDTELYDTSSYHSTSSNTSRLTAPSTGYYLITADIEFASNSSGVRYLKIRKNGSTEYTLDLEPGRSIYQTSLKSAVTLALTAGDYVEAVVYQDSGGSVNVAGAVYHQFQMILLGM